MSQRFSRSLAFAALLSLVATACGDSTTIVDLVIVETVPVDFGDMAGQTPEVAEVNLQPLTETDEYREARDALRCGSIDLENSSITVDRLTVGAGATVLNFQVDVSARGSANWVFLAEYDGSIAALDRFTMTHPRFTIDQTGLAEVSRIVMGAEPALDLRVTGEVPGGVDALQVALSLTLVFSNDVDGCP